MFRFENESYLWALTAIPIFILFYLLWRHNRSKKLADLGGEKLAIRIMPESSRSKPLIKFALLCLAYVLLVLGAANPQVGSKMEEIKREGVEIVVALDVSNSMRAEDIKPNRLERAKQSIVSLINSLVSDKFGMVVFAGEAYLQMPLTTDYSAAKLILSNIDTWMIPTQGTAAGKAIETATETFSDNKKIGKTLILISDGENHEDDAIGAAKEAQEKGIVIHTIGIGSVSGAPISLGNQQGYLKDENGQMVMSRMNPDILKDVAKAGGGKFLRAGSSDPDLAKLLSDINSMNKGQFGTKVFTDYDDKFQYFLAAAFILLMIESVIGDKFNRLFRALNSFIEGKK